tara:strand:+ start:3235 stop:4590 length:1356 start_codon:yes stop_codon:yes gene_type:complete
MADIVQSLFGVTPQAYQQAQQDRMDAQALQYAKHDPFQQANYAIGRGASGLAGAIGGALGGQDPELQRITLRQQIAGQLNPNDISTFDRGIEILRQGGDGQGALMLQMERDKAQQLALTRGDEALVRSDAATKRRLEAAALLQRQQAQTTAQGAYVPPVPEQQQFVEVDAQGQPVAIPAQPASFDIQRVAPELMRTAAGRTELKNLLDAQKLMRPETVSIKEGETIYSVPTTPGGAYKPIMSGGEKPTPFTGEMANAALTLYKTSDPAKIFKDFGQAGLDAVDKKALQMSLAKRPVTNINMPSEGERKAATLANRLNFSVDQINQAIGIDPTAAMPNNSSEIARFLTRSEIISNKLTPVQRQIVESAQLDILDAALTLGTGAAYTQAQLEGYRKSYFPQIGDKPENVVSKRARLQNILKSAEIASGRAKVPTQIPTAGADLSSIINAPASN